MLAALTLDSASGRAAISAVLVVAVVVVAWAFGAGASRAFEEPQQRYNARRLVRSVAWIVVAIGLVFVWKPLGGNLGPALGLATAGIAFAMQEVIGAIAGWFNITFGGIFRVGDRVEMSGVQGDVIDISLLKTRLMEIGSASGTTSSWVKGRQFTGRVVAVSNKASFTAPVFNYSSYFDFIWEEVEVGVPHHDDWERAAEILEREALRQSASAGAREAMAGIRRRFPVPMAEVEPRVFVSTDADYTRLSVRFVVSIRNARSAKDEIVRHMLTAFDEAGIEIVSTQVIQNAAMPWYPVGPTDDAGRRDGPAGTA